MSANLVRLARVAIVSTPVLMTFGCGGAPLAPSPTATFELRCNKPTVLAGEVVVCSAIAGATNVFAQTVWASSDPTVLTSEGAGLFIGRWGGQATVTATYSGQTQSARLRVDLQDSITASAAAFQGTFQVSTSATMWLQGGYGVASADSGTLTLVVRDQTDAVVSTSEPLTVPRGGDRYIMSTTFTLKPGTTRVCRTGILQAGSTTLTVVPIASLSPCITVVP